jgi:hypothetical protein
MALCTKLNMFCVGIFINSSYSQLNTVCTYPYAYELNAATFSFNIVNRIHNSVLFTFITDRISTLSKQSIKISSHDNTEMSNSLRNGWPSKSVTQ